MEAILSKSGNTELSLERFIIAVSGPVIMGVAKWIVFGGNVSEPAPLDVSSVIKILKISN